MDINAGDLVLLEYENYNDYLRSFLRREDYCYLSKDRTRRALVRLGYRSTSIVYDEKQFQEHKDTVLEFVSPKISGFVNYSDICKSGDPVLLALKHREKVNNMKKLSTIIFLKYRLKSGFEISAYIDFEESLRRCNQGVMGATDWHKVFEESKMIKPKPRDLSYYNLRHKLVTYNDSDNYKVIHDPHFGMMFMHRGDHKRIPIGPDPKEHGENVVRTLVYSPKYEFVVFYDHVVRKKN